MKAAWRSFRVQKIRSPDFSTSTFLVGRDPPRVDPAAARVEADEIVRAKTPCAGNAVI
jgi:hypothetical protein